jgi:glycosyltransferase involved in cell wall biosynthesis
MLKIGVYLESSLDGALGGAQTHCAVLLELLSKDHDVELIVRSGNFRLDALAAASSTDLDQVRVVQAPAVREDGTPAFNREYDVFVAFVHGKPPVCPARIGVLMVLFPLPRSTYWPWCARDSSNWLRQSAREAYHALRWRKRLAGYQVVTANSEFTRRWTKDRWSVDATVVYPPVDLTKGVGEKKDLILSVGRYTSSGLSKNQKELLTAYEALKLKAQVNWDFYCAGAVSSGPDSRLYYEECAEIATRSGARTLPNIDSVNLRNLYAEAKLFWHAAGVTHDEHASPETSEHFGMVTVEAMANGCVPVVIRRGGQVEIIQHGQNGYLWNTLEELQEYTARLAAEPDKLRDLADAAKCTANKFSRRAFVNRMSHLLAPHIA